MAGGYASKKRASSSQKGRPGMNRATKHKVSYCSTSKTKR